jgi:hypothetical protein
MHKKLMLAATIAVAAPLAQAAAPVFLVEDHSVAAVMDKATALSVWKENLPDKMTMRLGKIYKTSRWGFLSQVEGGFTDNKTCVVTARAAFVPLSRGRILFAPDKMATTFDAQPGLTGQQCKDLAKAKLGESVKSVVTSLAAPK